MDRFAWPWLLALLVLVPLIVWIPGRERRGGLLHTRTGLLAHRAGSWRTNLLFLPSILRAAALSLAIVALARPQKVEGHVKTNTEGVAIQLVIDRSGSMKQDMRYGNRAMSRLEVVKRVAREFVLGDTDEQPSELKGREGDMVGLIAFAGYADTVCPLVRTHSALADLLEGVQPAQYRGEDGTAIGSAIALACARLKDAEEEIQRSMTGKNEKPDFTIKSKVIILLTDGQNTTGIDPGQAAALAAEWGIRIYTIGIGDGGGSGMSAVFAHQGVDRGLLTSIAERTGGQYFSASDAEALRQVYDRIDKLEKTRIETQEFTNYRELFQPLAVGALAAVAVETLLRTLVLRRTA